MSQTNLLALAKQGDANAIAALMNRSLQPKGITAKVSRKDSFLQVMLEAASVPNQQALANLVHQGIVKLEPNSINQIRVYGRKVGEDFPDWQQDFALEESNNPFSCLDQNSEPQALAPTLAVSEKPALLVEQPASCLNQNSEAQASVSTLVVSSEEPVALIEQPTSQPQAEETPQVQESSWWGSLVGAVAGATGTVGGVATQAGQAIVGTTVGVGGTIANTAMAATGAVGGVATQAGQAIAGTTIGVGGAIANTAMQAPAGVGYLLGFVSDSPQLQELTKALKIDWLINIVGQVDIVRAETHVRNLQKKYPNERPGEIAHRVMMEKALYVGGTGFATSLMPGFAAAMFAVDLAATMALQAEMVYQIASAYGLDLHDPARKGEVLSIFSLALGGSAALEAGLGFARNIPVAGALIGASSNAAMLYALGYAACQFYETKLNPSTASTAVEVSKEEAEECLQNAIAQQVIMDQILVHVFLAGKPGTTWQQILPELQSLNFSPASVEAITTNLQSPPSLETLLDQISNDFAIPLVAQCQKIVQLDGVVTSEEEKVLAKITNKLKINLTAMN
jgi:uncharacterized protein (DUF697 family)